MNALRHLPVNQQVYNHLHSLIVTRQLAPGTRLDEQALAAEMGVSRTPVREAVGRLVEKGLVEYRPYQGSFVRTLSPQEVSDIYQVRRALEELAIRLTIDKLTPEKLDALREVLDEIGQAMQRGDMAAVSEADGRFHSLIARFSENATLIDQLDALGQQVQLIRVMANENPEVVKRTGLQRPQILAALEARDADLAARLLGEHIEFVRQAAVAEKEAEARGENPEAPGTHES